MLRKQVAARLHRARRECMSSNSGVDRDLPMVVQHARDVQFPLSVGRFYLLREHGRLHGKSPAAFRRLLHIDGYPRKFLTFARRVPKSQAMVSIDLPWFGTARQSLSSAPRNLFWLAFLRSAPRFIVGLSFSGSFGS